MTKLTQARKRPTGHPHKAAVHTRKEGFEFDLGTYLPAGSPQRTTAEIAAAAGGALLAAAILGVGPAALAGAAGYLVYRNAHH